MKNRIINGAFTVSQYNGTSAVTNVSASYVIDRFQTGYFGGGTGRTTVQQSSTAPSGFINSQLVTVTTADVSPTSTSGYWLASQKIEGLNTSDLAWGTASAKTITVSAWVYSSVTGSFPLIISNSAADRNYGALFIVSSANTWTQISVTIAGDTTGTWLTTNGIGIQVIFGAGGSSSRTISTGWNTGSGSVASNVTGATQLIATNGATFYITGVQLEVGSSATGYEYRQYGQELALCQRYFWQLSYVSGTSDPRLLGFVQTSTIADYPIQFPVTPRVPPTGISLVGGGTLNVSGTSSGGTPTITFVNNSYSGIIIRSTTTAGSPVLTQGGVGYLNSSSGTVNIQFTGFEL